MVKRVSILLIIFLSLFFLSVDVYAEEDDISDRYSELIENLPNDIADLLPEDIFSLNLDDLGEGVGQLTSWDFIIDRLLDILGLNIKEIIKVLAALCSIIILCVLLNMLKKVISNSGLTYVIELVGCSVVGTTIISLSKPILDRTLLLCEDIKVFINTISPLICGMYAMGGNISTAVVQNYGLIVFLSIFENVCVLLLQIILGVSMSLVIASIFIRDNSLLSINSAIKNGFTFFLGFIMLIYSTVISAQTLLSSKGDTLSSKTVKMLTTQIIPVIGGTIGESLRTAGASIEYLRSNIGILLIVAFILMILPTIISIGFYRLAFIIANSFAGLIGCDEEAKVLNEISSIYGYGLAILSICSITLLFLLTIFAKCASPL